MNMKPVRRSAKELVGQTGPSCIRLKVLERTDMHKSLESQELEYQMFKFEDQEGSEVQTILFEHDLVLFQDIMQDDMTYEISNAQVKLMPVDEWVTPDRQTYELTFNHNTFVLPISDPPPPIKLEYILMASIPRACKLNDRFDVLGIVIYVDQTLRVPRRNGQSENICEVLIVDQSSEQIMIVTAWENLAIEHCKALKSIATSFPVVSFATLMPTCRKGFSLSTTHLTCISVEPQGQEADTLRAWKMANHEMLDAKHRQVFQSRHPGHERTITTIELLLQKKVNDTLQEEQHWLRVKLLDFAHGDVFLYFGCSKCGTCNYESCGATYTCTACFEENVISTPRMCFPFVAMDGTGAYCFSARTKDAEKILQVTAAALHSMTSQAQENYLIQIENRLKNTPIYIQVVSSLSLSRAQVLKWVLHQVSLT